MKNKIILENKDKLIKAARVAKSRPEDILLWEAVRERMDVREKSLVKKRNITH